MFVLALDPGPSQTGWATMSGPVFAGGGVLDNARVLELVSLSACDVLAIEMIASYGMPVGREVFETCVWIGRFIQASRMRDRARLVFRQEVKLFLCRSTKAKDSNVRQAILDRFPATGGGAVKQVGTKKAPGPLFGVSSHAWPALGVALFVNPETNPDAIPGPTDDRPTPRRRLLGVV